MSSNLDDIDKINGSPPTPPSSSLPTASASSIDQIIQPWSLIDGELLVANVSELYFVVNSQKVKGKFYLSNFRFYFKSDEPQKPKDNQTTSVLSEPAASISTVFVHLILDVPLGLIQRIEKLYFYNNTNQLNEFIGMLIDCKDGRKLKFNKLSEDSNFEKAVLNNLNTYAFPLSNNLKPFAFHHKPKLSSNDGWNIYNHEQEFTRMGLNDCPKWRISTINNEFAFCETYPSLFAVPSTTTDNDLERVGEFRSKNRIPVLSWIKPVTNAAILRSSQPLCGMSGKRNFSDENFLRNITETNTKNNILHVLDARPYLNALANCTTGGGYENEKYYTFCRLSFLNIENIHAMRNSLGANNDRDFFSNLENSKWLEHIKIILDGALKLVDLVDSDFSVLVHCSDGWDRTAQLTSLSMLMLDKYYRTLQGFEVLIEKEWLSFGHRFETRMGHGSDKYSDQDRSPIFLQFIDCVWQIMQQSKNCFEFNEKFLLFILQNMYSCQYGTFLMDSECERERNSLKTTTTSFWSYINSHKDEFLNKDYIEYDYTIKCTTTFNSLKLWTDYYFQYKDTSDIIVYNGNDALQKSIDTVGNLIENIAPTGFNFLSNGFKLFNQIKSNLRN